MRVLLDMNIPRKYSALLAVRSIDLKPSVAQIRASIQNAERAVDLIAAALLQNEIELEKGAVISIDIIKSRVRLLPL